MHNSLDILGDTMNNTLPISTLFVDVGGVLLTNGWGHGSRELAAKTFNLDFQEMESRHRITFDTFEIGKLSLKEYLNRTVFYEKRNFDQAQFQEFMLSQSKAFPEMISLIINLKKKYGLKVVIMSNEGKELNEYRIKKFELDKFVDFFMSSCIVHLRKPDEDIFKLALELAQVKPNQVIYLDDRLMFTQVAQGLGIQGIHHVDYATSCAQLAAHGLSQLE